MKSKKISAASLAMAAIFLLGAAISPAGAYDTIIQNSTGENINVNLNTRSSFSWDTGVTGLLHQNRVIEAGNSTNLQIPVDSSQACLSYVYGYNADFSKGIVIMGCDGTENNMKSRCCANFNYNVVKKSDGTFHFVKQ